MGLSTRSGGRGPGRAPSVLYADLDGTITGPGGSLFAASDGGTTLAAAGALARLREEGVSLVLMSGRTRLGIHEVAVTLGASAYLAELGGQLVELERFGGKPPNEVIRYPAVPEGSAQEIVRSGAGGLLLVAVCPIGGISNTYSYLARAATALSVSLTGLSSSSPGSRSRC